MSSSAAWAAPRVIPSTATVMFGQTVQFTSTDTVTCALRSGSLGSVNPATCVYSAPPSSAAFVPSQMLGGCAIMPEDSVFHSDISGLPVLANNAAKMAWLYQVHGASITVGADVDMPINTYSEATPAVSLSCRYTHSKDGTYPVYGFPDRAEEASNMTSDLSVETSDTQDHHILGISSAAFNGVEQCHMYEMYGYYPPGTDPARPLNNTQSCTHYGNLTYDLPDTTAGDGGAVDAAGMFILPLVPTYRELQSGSINHAMRITLNNNAILSNQYLWPAVAAASGGCADSTKCVKYGTRVRLKSSYSIPANASPGARAVYTALKKYGAFMNDGGTSGHITYAQDATKSTTTWASVWSEINGSIVFGTDMEWVDESSLMVSTSSSKVNLAANAVTNYAEVWVIKSADSSSTSVRIALSAPAAGTYNPAFQGDHGSLTVQAGTPQFQIPYWVTGSTDTVATCSMSPTVGTLTSDCKYTAPTNQYNQLLVSTVTISPRISPNNKYTFPLIVFSSDAIRMRMGTEGSSHTTPPFDASMNYVDASGNKWFKEPVGQIPNFHTRDSQGNPGSPPDWIGSATDYPLCYGFSLGSGDKVWSAMVPNGMYQVKMMFGMSAGNSAYVGVSSNSIESQGVMITSTQSLVTATFQPNVVISTVAVSDNRLHVAIRGNIYGHNSFISGLSMMKIAELPSGPTTPRIFGRGRARSFGRVRPR